MAKRTFSELKKRMGIKQFNLFCKQVATEYAYTEVYKATTFFTNNYNITDSCYKKIKDYAITHFLVSDYVVELMERKSVENQKRSSSSTGASSKNHYQKLRIERKKYIFELANEYINHPELTLYQLIEKRGRGADGYYYMLCEAFIGEYGVTYKMAKQIVARMFNDCPSKDKMDILNVLVERLWEERKARRGEETE